MADTLRVLLVEDSADDALLLQLALEQGGFAPQVTRVEREDALREALAAEAWDLVISDYRLPHFDGLAALRLVRAVDPDTPFVLVSGKVGEEIAVEAMRAGAGDFVLKDHLVRLAPAVARELQEAENRRARRRVEAEREHLLAEVERRAGELDLTLGSIADGVVIYDVEGRIQRMNDAARQIAGYSPETEARSLEDRMRPLVLKHPDGTPYTYEQNPIYRALLHQETTSGEIIVFERGDRTVWVSASVAPIVAPDGRRIGAIGTLSDITALHELQERERRYLYTLAHNLRAPATLVSGNLQLLLEAIEPSALPASCRGTVAALQRSLQRMNTMVDDFYLVTQLDEGALVLSPVPTDLGPFLDALLRRNGALLEAARIEVDLAPGLPPVLADPERLRTILLNLLQNAQKFSAPGTPIRLSARPGDGQVEISVADQGIGIAPEELPHVFDRFYRAERIRRAEGTGLGLHIVRRLVEAQGGCVRAESTEGRGSTFSFTVPAA